MTRPVTGRTEECSCGPAVETESDRFEADAKTHDVLGAELAQHALEQFDLDGVPWRVAIAALHTLRQHLDRAENQVVTGALQEGVTWAEVGYALLHPDDPA